MLGITTMQENSASTSDLLSQGRSVLCCHPSPLPKWRGQNLSKAIPSLLSLHHDTLFSCFYSSCWVGFNVNCDVLLYGPEIRLPDEEHVPISFKIQLYHWSPFLFNLSKSRNLWQDFSSCFPGWLNCPTFPQNAASPLTAGRAVEDAFGRLWQGWLFLWSEMAAIPKRSTWWQLSMMLLDA